MKCIAHLLVVVPAAAIERLMRVEQYVRCNFRCLLKLLLLVLYLVFVSGPQFSLAGTKLFYFQISVRRGFKGRDMLLLLAVIAA